MQLTLLDSLPLEAMITLSLGILLIATFLSTRVMKKVKLPFVSGYILTGILLGPYVLKLIPQSMVDGMNFLSDVALAFIAFGTGRFFKKETLQASGRSGILITVLEALLAGILVTAAMLLMGTDTNLALLLGAIATATAPASTMMTINQYHARGPFVNLLLQVVALDDIVCLLVFSLMNAVVTASTAGTMSAAGVLLPLACNIAAIALGGVFGFLLWKLLPPTRTRDNRLIIVLAMLLLLTGLCSAFEVSPLLSCMAFGAFYINCSQDKQLFKQLNHFNPPIMSLFFAVSGARLNITLLPAFGLVGVVYFLVRIIGKYVGTVIGCKWTHQDALTTRWLGGALVPQAGVAIGLASLAERILPESIGSLLLTIILSSSVLYELIGPACAKFSLSHAGVLKLEPAQAADEKALPVGRQVRAADKVEDMPENDTHKKKSGKGKKKKKKKEA